jgi:hypothetical protein
VIVAMVWVVRPKDGWEEDNILPPPHTHLYRASDALEKYSIMYLMYETMNLKSDHLNST